ncbi:flagellin [bacterium]|nr:flagellin [bacterium]MDC1262714.1 flagellin [Planktomarina temperata]
MSMVINTNTASLIAQAAQSKTQGEMETAMERLSTGKRINSSSDDAAGMAMSARMESQIKGLTMSMRNAGDAQSLVDATEGAHDEITNVLHRMRELSVQAASSTNVSSDLTNIQTEMTQLIAEIDRISGQTTWNGMNLLDGTFASKQFQIGPEAGQTVSVTVANAATSQLGAYEAEAVGHLFVDAADATLTPMTDAETITVAGSKGTVTIASPTSDSAKSFAANVNLQEASTGVSATAVTIMKISANNSGTTADEAASLADSTTIDLNVNGTAITQASVSSTDMRDLRDKINLITATTGVSAKMGDTNLDLILTDGDGDNIIIDNFVTNTNATILEVAMLKADSSTDAGATEADATDEYATNTILKDDSAAGFQQVVGTGSVSFSAVGDFTISGGEATSTTNADVVPGTLSGALSTVSTIDITTIAGANSSIKALDGAIEMITSRRADLGAVSNRLDHTIANLSTNRVNMEASQSRIEDADFAVETSNLTKAQILSQAATAMLAQANASKQSVLSLLQG